MKIDFEKTKEKLQAQGSDDRKRVSLYVSASKWEAFMKACEPVSASLMIEDWISQALEQVEQGKVKRK